MELGIFAKIFDRSDLAATLDAVVAAGFRSVQFNVESTGLAPLPDSIPADIAATVKRETEARGITITALSGTYNMIHPDRERRTADFNRFRVIAASARAMGADTLTLCTGTRNTESMWVRQPDNDLPDAWDDLVESMRRVLDVAEEFDLRVALEPEPGNVVNSSVKAKRLIDTFANDRLGVVIDAVNAMDTAPDRDAVEVLVEAFYLLRNHIFVAHAKEHDAAGHEAPTGTGVVPWAQYIELLRTSGFTGPLIMHGLSESEVAESRAFLREVIDSPWAEAQG
jgi:sugar phosphate isomerase/epimerase